MSKKAKYKSASTKLLEVLQSSIQCNELCSGEDTEWNPESTNHSQSETLLEAWLRQFSMVSYVTLDWKTFSILYDGWGLQTLIVLWHLLK